MQQQNRNPDINTLVQPGVTTTDRPEPSGPNGAGGEATPETVDPDPEAAAALAWFGADPHANPTAAALAEGFADPPTERPVAVLASGDPYLFGVGALLAARVPASETLCLPAPSAVSLACARLGWAGQDCATVSVCGRPIEGMIPHLQPGARVLALSAGTATPAALADLLRRHGFGPSVLHVLEALGGPRERVRTTTADAYAWDDVQALNLVGIEVAATPGARVVPLACAVTAERLAPGAAAWFAAGHRSTEPGQSLALEALRLEPLLDLGLRLGEGSGAVAAVPLVRSAAVLLRDVALLSDLGIP